MITESAVRQKNTKYILLIILLLTLTVGVDYGVTRFILPALPNPHALPIKFPVPSLTLEQVAEVRACDIRALSSGRYPDSIASDVLIEAYAPQTGCDWAALAFAYTVREDGSGTFWEDEKYAFSQAVLKNHGYAFSDQLFGRYFGAVPVVGAPDFSSQEITDVHIEYGWNGMGFPVEYTLDINAMQSLTPGMDFLTNTVTIDSEAVQALSGALTDLLPVDREPFYFRPCTDNFPSWQVDLTYADGTEIHLSTESNYLSVGGPWFVRYQEQIYMQYSGAFAGAVSKLVAEDAGYMLGWTLASVCFYDGFFDYVFEKPDK